MADPSMGSPRGALTATRMGAPPAWDDDAASASEALAGWNEAETTKLARARLALRVTGGVVSLGLVAGLALWGHKLMLREVLGVPVVEAAEGPMRVAPQDPGGTVAADLGLSVNGVPAAGGAAGPSDVLLLAPPGPGLAPEDMEVIQTSAEATEPRLGAEAAEAAPDALGVTDVVATSAPPAEAAAVPVATLPADRPLTAEEVLALADSIAGEAAPLAPLAPGEDVPVETVLAQAEAAPAPEAVPAPTLAVIPASVPGVAAAPRPFARPGSALAQAPDEPQAEAEAPAAPVALTTDLAAGTTLVQLGAFDSPEVAASEWERLQGAFAEFLDGRERVIQEAVSGGQTFYRLRATGFADLADARRLCAVLDAEGEGCITFVVP